MFTISWWLHLHIKSYRTHETGVFTYMNGLDYMGVSKNNGTPKSSILIGFSIINHPFWGTPIFGNTHMVNVGS